LVRGAARAIIFSPPQKESIVQSHEIDYRIYGGDLQFVEVYLDPGESVIAEAGAMIFMDEGVTFEAKLGDGSDAQKGRGFFRKAASAAGRAMSGESLFMTHFTNSGGGRAKVAFGASVPGKIVPLDLAEIGQSVICQRDAFLCAALGTRVSMHLNRRFGSGMFGGEGFILQKLEGDGVAFVNAGGMVVERRLAGETIRVDTGCLVGFEEGLDYSIERAGGLKTMAFGGEGIFLATISGVGRVWLQSLPFSRLADPIISAAVSQAEARVSR